MTKRFSRSEGISFQPVNTLDCVVTLIYLAQPTILWRVVPVVSWNRIHPAGCLFVTEFLDPASWNTTGLHQRDRFYSLCEFSFQVGDSPLSRAASLGYTTTVELLFGHGADVDGTDQAKSSSHSLEVQSWTTDNWRGWCNLSCLHLRSWTDDQRAVWGFFSTRSCAFRNLSAAAKARRLSSFMDLKLAFSPSVIRAIGLFRTVGSFCAFGLLRWHRKGTVLYLPHVIIYVEGRATTSVLLCEIGGYS